MLKNQSPIHHKLSLRFTETPWCSQATTHLLPESSLYGWSTPGNKNINLSKKQNRPQGPYSLECRRLIWCRTLALHLFPIALPGQSRIPFNVMLNFIYHSTFAKIKRWNGTYKEEEYIPSIEQARSWDLSPLRCCPASSLGARYLTHYIGKIW